MTLEQVKETNIHELASMLDIDRRTALLVGWFEDNSVRNMFLKEFGEPIIEYRTVRGMTDSEIVEMLKANDNHFLRHICSPLITE